MALSLTSDDAPRVVVLNASTGAEIFAMARDDERLAGFEGSMFGPIVWRDDGLGFVVHGFSGGGGTPSGVNSATVMLDGGVTVHFDRSSWVAPNGRFAVPFPDAVPACRAYLTLDITDLDTMNVTASITQDGSAFAPLEWSPDASRLVLQVYETREPNMADSDCPYALVEPAPGTQPSMVVVDTATSSMEPLEGTLIDLRRQWYGDAAAWFQCGDQPVPGDFNATTGQLTGICSGSEPIELHVGDEPVLTGDPAINVIKATLPVPAQPAASIGATGSLLVYKTQRDQPGSDARVHVYDSDRREEIAAFDVDDGYSPQLVGATVLIAAQDSVSVYALDGSSQTLHRSTDDRTVNDAALSPDGTLLAVAESGPSRTDGDGSASGGRFAVIEVATGQEIVSLPVEDPRLGDFRGYPWQVRWLADGSGIIVAGGVQSEQPGGYALAMLDGSVRVLFNNHSMVSPDARLITTDTDSSVCLGSGPSDLQIVDFATNEVTASVAYEERIITPVEWAPDGSTLLVHTQQAERLESDLRCGLAPVGEPELAVLDIAASVITPSDRSIIEWRQEWYGERATWFQCGDTADPGHVFAPESMLRATCDSGEPVQLAVDEVAIDQGNGIDVLGWVDGPLQESTPPEPTPTPPAPSSGEEVPVWMPEEAAGPFAVYRLFDDPVDGVSQVQALIQDMASGETASFPASNVAGTGFPQVLQGEVVTISEAGDRLIATSPTGEQRTRYEAAPGVTIMDAEYSPDGALLAISAAALDPESGAKRVAIIDAASGEELFGFDEMEAIFDEAGFRYFGYFVHWRASGTELLLLGGANRDEQYRYDDERSQQLATFRLDGTLQPHPFELAERRISPDGRYGVASADAERCQMDLPETGPHVAIVDLDSGATVASATIEGRMLFALEWGADGQHLILESLPYPEKKTDPCGPIEAGARAFYLLDRETGALEPAGNSLTTLREELGAPSIAFACDGIPEPGLRDDWVGTLHLPRCQGETAAGVPVRATSAIIVNGEPIPIGKAGAEVLPELIRAD